MLKPGCALASEYLSQQVECGVHAVQLFDSMCGSIDADTFRAAALPRLKSIAFSQMYLSRLEG